ncbi:hypothetical protein MTO96_016348 [Rhipicephalus appendiculatus]
MLFRAKPKYATTGRKEWDCALGATMEAISVRSPPRAAIPLVANEKRGGPLVLLGLHRILLLSLRSTRFHVSGEKGGCLGRTSTTSVGLYRAVTQSAGPQSASCPLRVTDLSGRRENLGERKSVRAA